MWVILHFVCVFIIGTIQMFLGYDKNRLHRTAPCIRPTHKNIYHFTHIQHRYYIVFYLHNLKLLRGELESTTQRGRLNEEIIIIDYILHINYNARVSVLFLHQPFSHASFIQFCETSFHISSQFSMFATDYLSNRSP